jgi:RimJ/RimL family protein N-acetyltransferase
MFRYRADPEVARYQAWKPRSLEEIDRFLERNAECADLAPGTWYQVGIADRADALIGDIGIHTPSDAAQAELGVTLAPTAQRLGLATEALTALLDWMFGDLRRHRVVASVDPRNGRSIALLQRLQFRQEAHFRESLHINGAWVDDMVFAMLQRDWQRESDAGHKAHETE